MNRLYGKKKGRKQTDRKQKNSNPKWAHQGNNSKKSNKTRQKNTKPKTGSLSQYILAAYYNDARLNILSCLNDIRVKIGKKPVENEDQIRSAFSDLNLADSTPERQDELIKHLRYRFPFLDLLTDAGKNSSKKSQQDTATPLPFYYESHLNWMLKLINGLRNTMAHPVDAEISIPYHIHKKLFHALRKVYDSSFHTVKTRFGHETNTMESFKRCDHKGDPKTPQQFALALCLNIDDVEESSDLPQSNVLYDFGHVLFCSLFLEKSQSAELINYFWDTCDQQKWGDTAKRSIAREMIAVYRQRLPIQRLKSDDTPTSVTMDTLSELTRCPRSLLEMLKPEHKNLFRGEPGQPDDTSGDHTQANTQDNNTPQVDTYLFARSQQDRFIPLMMRFFDFNEQNRIRFAVDLGQFYYNVRLKPASEYTDGKPRVRRLSQKIIDYGRLIDYEKSQKPEDWQQLEKNYQESRDDEDRLLKNAGQTIEQLKGYIVQTYPHYHYFDNKIGFRLDMSREGSSASYPDLNAHRANQPEALTNPKGKDMLPEFWMNQEQLLQLAFYSYLQQDNGTILPLHLVLNKYRSGIKKMFNILRTGDVNLEGEPNSRERRDKAQTWINKQFDNDNGKSYQIPLSGLPKVVVRYLLGKADHQVKVRDVIKRAERILKHSESLKTHLRKQLQIADKKRGQKGFRAIKCGPIGDFIAADLMRFQPVDGNRPDGGKINSQQYQILQKVLAYYGAHIQGKEPPNIVDLLRDANLLSGSFAHPFIGTLQLENQPDKYQGLISFYEAYLEARICYLKQYIKEHRHRKDMEFIPHWLRMRKPSTLNSWLKEQLDKDGKLTQPVPLASNMLYPPVLQMVSQALDIDPQAIEDEGTQTFMRGDENIKIPPAITWLIKYYLREQGDKPQRMYSEYPRRHKLIDTLKDNRGYRQRFHEKKPQYQLESERQESVKKARKYINEHYPDNEKEVERIRQLFTQPNKKEGYGDSAKAIKLKGLIPPYKRDEQRVRFSVSQDMLLYLSASHYLESLQLSNEKEKPVWTLHGIEKTLLKTEIDYHLKIPDTEKELKHPACKIRDRGELTLLVRDRRLKSLMPYYSLDEIVFHHTEIRYELHNYRRAKVNVMKNVHELEKQIINVLGEIPNRDEEQEKQTKRHFGKGRHGDFLYGLYTHYTESHSEQSDAFNPKSFKRTLLIRNAFSHNQYPDEKIFSEIAEQVRADAVPDNPTLNRKVAERLQQEMEALYDPWLRYLKQTGT